MLKFSQQVGQYHVTFVHWLQKPTDNITHTTDHITPVLRQLHWLPVCQRVVFKIAGLVHHLLVGAAPAYLIEDDCRLLSDVGRRPLRSNSNDMRRLFMLWTHNNLVIAVSRPPVLDCGMPSTWTTAALTYLWLLQTISENSFIWQQKRFVTLLNV